MSTLHPRDNPRAPYTCNDTTQPPLNQSSLFSPEESNGRMTCAEPKLWTYRADGTAQLVHRYSMPIAKFPHYSQGIGGLCNADKTLRAQMPSPMPSPATIQTGGQEYGAPPLPPPQQQAAFVFKGFGEENHAVSHGSGGRASLYGRSTEPRDYFQEEQPKVAAPAPTALSSSLYPDVQYGYANAPPYSQAYASSSLMAASSAPQVQQRFRGVPPGYYAASTPSSYIFGIQTTEQVKRPEFSTIQAQMDSLERCSLDAKAKALGLKSGLAQEDAQPKPEVMAGGYKPEDVGKILSEMRTAHRATSKDQRVASNKALIAKRQTSRKTVVKAEEEESFDWEFLGKHDVTQQTTIPIAKTLSSRRLKVDEYDMMRDSDDSDDDDWELVETPIR